MIHIAWEVVSEMSAVGISPIDQLLSDRGHDPEAFLNPSLDQLHDYYLMIDMDKAIERTKQAIDTGELIRISGDYDADGISSTYVMMRLLGEAGADVSYEIPNRKDGYGLSNKIIDNAYRDGCTLIITCDNGIACIDQVEYAKTLGIDVIITDHHEPQGVIPDTIVVNPKRHDCPYPFKELAGCAVAWKFCEGVLTEYKLEHKILDVIEIVATGTVADVMDLVDENRVIVSFGLQAYRDTQITGLAQLIKEMDLRKYPISTTTIGYSIGPALNATGRLASADEGVELLLETSKIKSLRNAKYLADLNKERKEWTETYMEMILDKVAGSTDKVVLFAQPEIPEGILGIIASRVMNELNRPILLMSLNETGEFYKGSGRSVKGYDLFESLMKHRDLFIGVGGHEMACGFSIPVENVPVLRQLLNEECTLTDDDLIKNIYIDYDIDAQAVNMKLATDLLALEPYGKGNPKPLFQLQNCQILKHQYIGANKKTLKLTVLCLNYQFECIGFNMVDKLEDIFAEEAEDFTRGDDNTWIDIAFYPGINEWNGRKSLQLELTDIKKS